MVFLVLTATVLNKNANKFGTICGSRFSLNTLRFMQMLMKSHNRKYIFLIFNKKETNPLSVFFVR